MRITALLGALALGRVAAHADDTQSAASLRAELDETRAMILEMKMEIQEAQRRALLDSAGASTKSAHEFFLEATASFTEDRRQLSQDNGQVYSDETIIEDTFVSTSLVNASRMTLAGMELGTTLAEFSTRLNVLDQFLKVANVAHYYSYYFGVFLTDGGRAYDQYTTSMEIFDPYGLTVATINNKNYAFICASGDDTIAIYDVSNIDAGTIATEFPPVVNFNAIYAPAVGANLDYPYAIDYHVIGTKHYLFVTTINTDGVMIIDVTNPAVPLYVSFTRDTNVNFDKIANAYGIKAWTYGGKTWLAVSSYSYNTVADGGNGVQIMDVSIPANPKFAASMVDGTNGFRCLMNPWGIDIKFVNGAPFLFVTAFISDCLQVIDITEPRNPVAAYAYKDMQGLFSYMDGPMSVKVFEVNNKYYAAVNSYYDHTIVFVDVTDPYNCKEASAASYTSSMSSTGQLFYGIGITTTGQIGEAMDVYRTTDVFGRTNTFMVTVGYVSYGTLQLIDVSQPSTPIAVAWIQGQTNPALPYYMMYYYTRGVKVIENKGKHYAIVACEYGSESTTYPNGFQIVKLDPRKTWDLTTTWASDSDIYYTI